MMPAHMLHRNTRCRPQRWRAIMKTPCRIVSRPRNPVATRAWDAPLMVKGTSVGISPNTAATTIPAPPRGPTRASRANSRGAARRRDQAHSNHAVCLSSLSGSLALLRDRNPRGIRRALPRHPHLQTSLASSPLWEASSRSAVSPAAGTEVRLSARFLWHHWQRQRCCSRSTQGSPAALGHS